MENWVRNVLVGALIFFLSSCAISSTAKFSGGSTEAADEILTEILAKDASPGVMAAVVKEGKLIWSGADGFSDLEANVPLTTDTKMRIGSVSKTLTAALILKLADSRRLGIDDDIRKEIPELRSPFNGKLTPSMLASHVGGIRHYDFSNYLEANNVYFYSTLDEAMAPVLDSLVKTAPGSTFTYSSFGYNLLGLYAVRKTNTSFDVLLEEVVTTPLKLQNTQIDHPLQIVEGRTRFYTKFPDGNVQNTNLRDSSDYYPSGGLLSTAEDLARFAHLIFSTDWLSDDTKELLNRQVTTTSGEASPYSVGWDVVRDKNSKIIQYQHGGVTKGANALLIYWPDEKLSIAAITNMNIASGEPHFFEAIEKDLSQVFGAAE